MRVLFPLLILLFCSCASLPATEEATGETTAEPRSLASDTLPWKRQDGVEAATSQGLHIVRSAAAQLELVNQPESGESVSAVAGRLGYLALTNAAMFGADYKTSIGYMRNFGVVNSSFVNPKLRGFLLWHPKKPGLPALKLGTKADLALYDTVFQTHRVWDPIEGILWKKGASIYIQVGLVGVDAQNRVLFFHHPARIDVHDLVEKILTLGLELKGLLYLDGGTHGALHLAPTLGESNNSWIQLPNLLGLKAAR